MEGVYTHGSNMHVCICMGPRDVCAYRMEGGCFDKLSYPEDLALASRSETSVVRVAARVAQGGLSLAELAATARNETARVPPPVDIEDLMRPNSSVACIHACMHTSQVLLLDIEDLIRVNSHTAALLHDAHQLTRHEASELAMHTCGEDFIFKPKDGARPFAC